MAKFKVGDQGKYGRVQALDVKLANARNAVAPELRRATKLRLKENFSDEYGSYRKGDVFQVYTYQFSPHHAILVAPGREVTLEVPWDKVEVANSRVCNSSNPVVRNAIAANMRHTFQ